MWYSAVGCIVMLLLSLLMAPLVAQVQTVGPMPRIGVLAPGVPLGPWVEAFKQGLRDLGYIEGQTIALDVHWDEYQRER